MSLSDILSEQAKTHEKYRINRGFSCALVHSEQMCRGLEGYLPRLFFMCFGFAPDPSDPRPVNFADFHRKGAAGLPAAFHSEVTPAPAGQRSMKKAPIRFL